MARRDSDVGERHRVSGLERRVNGQPRLAETAHAQLGGLLHAAPLTRARVHERVAEEVGRDDLVGRRPEVLEARARVLEHDGLRGRAEAPDAERDGREQKAEGDLARPRGGAAVGRVCARRRHDGTAPGALVEDVARIALVEEHARVLRRLNVDHEDRARRRALLLERPQQRHGLDANEHIDGLVERAEAEHRGRATGRTRRAGRGRNDAARAAAHSAGKRDGLDGRGGLTASAAPAAAAALAAAAAGATEPGLARLALLLRALVAAEGRRLEAGHALAVQARSDARVARATGVTDLLRRQALDGTRHVERDAHLVRRRARHEIEPGGLEVPLRRLDAEHRTALQHVDVLVRDRRLPARGRTALIRDLVARPWCGQERVDLERERADRALRVTVGGGRSGTLDRAVDGRHAEWSHRRGHRRLEGVCPAALGEIVEAAHELEEVLHPVVRVRDEVAREELLRVAPVEDARVLLAPLGGHADEEVAHLAAAALHQRWDSAVHRGRVDGEVDELGGRDRPSARVSPVPRRGGVLHAEGTENRDEDLAHQHGLVRVEPERSRRHRHDVGVAVQRAESRDPRIVEDVERRGGPGLRVVERGRERWQGQVLVDAQRLRDDLAEVAREALSELREERELRVDEERLGRPFRHQEHVAEHLRLVRRLGGDHHSA